MNLSVVICTFDRCENLRRTLESFCGQQALERVAWEILVVDNNSTDGTKAVCEQFINRLPLRYVLEARQGKSCALNRALSLVKAPLLLFTDDDVDVDERWVVSLVDAAQWHPEAVFFGGRVLPRWDVPPPRWVVESRLALLDFVFVRYDFGDAERALDSQMRPFFGANLAIRKQIFDDGYSFNENIGPQGRNLVHGEETELLNLLVQKGYKGIYVPGAIVHHRNDRARMTERYLRRYFKGAGMRETRVAGCIGGRRICFGAPLGLWRLLIKRGRRYLIRRAIRPTDEWIMAEVEMAMTWGAICEWRRQAQTKVKNLHAFSKT
jgi:glycosyltransferase involved in cell wall biosynthesis